MPAVRCRHAVMPATRQISCAGLVYCPTGLLIQSTGLPATPCEGVNSRHPHHCHLSHICCMAAGTVMHVMPRGAGHIAREQTHSQCDGQCDGQCMGNACVHAGRQVAGKLLLHRPWHMLVKSHALPTSRAIHLRRAPISPRRKCPHTQQCLHVRYKCWLRPNTTAALPLATPAVNVSWHTMPRSKGARE
jgi:hypothetical protein